MLPSEGDFKSAAMCARPFIRMSTRVADLHHLNADRGSVFHLNADPDPAPHQSDGESATTGLY
jgi:hypothetical protein